MGDIDFDTEKIISIVGTRNATSYGREICETLIREISQKYKNVLIVSGLAYGIDICAHKASLKYNIPTVGILGHGLDKLYPFVHRAIAEKMLESGGLATDFPGKTKIEPANFLRRNRIIAGLSDVTIIVESGEKGGALITADIASSYNRDVCAFPGRINDPQSKGCNMLIKKNGAAMIESLKDLEYLMGWERDFFKNQIQPVLFPELTNDEKKIFELLNSGDEFFIDKISQLTKYPINKVSSLLLNMEFKDVIVSLPGKMYKLKDL